MRMIHPPMSEHLIVAGMTFIYHLVCSKKDQSSVFIESLYSLDDRMLLKEGLTIHLSFQTPLFFSYKRELGLIAFVPFLSFPFISFTITQMNYCHRRESHVHVPLKRPSSSATGEGDDPLSSLQQLQIQCEEWIDYLRSQHLSEPFLLSELEVILDSGNLDVYISFCSKPTTLWWVHVLFLNSSFQHCFCRINGVDYSIPHTLMKQSLVKVIKWHH